MKKTTLLIALLSILSAGCIHGRHGVKSQHSIGIGVGSIHNHGKHCGHVFLNGVWKSSPGHAKGKKRGHHK